MARISTGHPRLYARQSTGDSWTEPFVTPFRYSVSDFDQDWRASAEGSVKWCGPRIRSCLVYGENAMLVSIRFCTVLGLLALLAVSASLLADESELVEPGIRKRVDESFTRFEALGFHETVLVATGVGVVLRKEYGSADRKRGVRNSSATAFGIVSLDKQFMSDAILILEQEGKPKTSG